MHAPRRRRKEIKSSSTTRTGHSHESDNLLSEEHEHDEIEALLARIFPRGKGKYKGKLPLNFFSCNKIAHIASKCPNNDRDRKNNFRSYKDKRKKECYLAKGVTDEESEGSDGDGITIVVVKEDNTEEGDMTLISSSNQCGDWVIDSGCTHHMTSDRNKFLSMEDCNGGTMRFGNDDPSVVKGKGSIALNDKLKL